jgi:hypothetical protein
MCLFFLVDSFPLSFALRFQSRSSRFADPLFQSSQLFLGGRCFPGGTSIFHSHGAELGGA